MNFNLISCYYNPINEKFDQLALLFKSGIGRLRLELLWQKSSTLLVNPANSL